MSINVSDLKKNSLTDEELKTLNSLLHKQNVALQNKCPTYEYYKYSTGKSYGTIIEKDIITSIGDIHKHNNDTSYDAEGPNGERIEIKSLRAGDKGYNILYEKNDDIKNEKITNRIFQQVKPKCADYFLFHVLYCDGSRLFLVPSRMISSNSGSENKEEGKFALGTQHRGNTSEGCIQLNTILSNANIFEIPDYELNKSYNFNDMINNVEGNLKRFPNSIRT